MDVQSRPDVGGLLLDLDGTLYLGDEAIPGAVETVRTLRADGIPCRFLTNTTRRSRADLAAWLGNLGFPIAGDDVFTAAVSAARWLVSEGLERVALYLSESTYADFADFEITDDSPDAVVVGARSLGVEPERIVVVGDDAETDVAGAMDAGMTGVLVRTGKHTEERLEASGVRPHAVLDSIADLPRFLEGRQ